MAIKSFRNKATEEIALGGKSKQTRRILPGELHFAAYRKLILLDNATTLQTLAAWPGLRFEKLSGDRKDSYSIRINDRFRICFYWDGANATLVEIVDYH